MNSSIFQKLTTALKNPLISGSAITTSGLILWFFRRNHSKMVVKPQIGGRHNDHNAYGSRHPEENKLQSQDIEISSDSQTKLRGWYIKHPMAQKIVIYYHENSGNIGHRLFYVKKLLEKSYVNVLLVAYRGFSESDGATKPREHEIMKDAAAILRKGIELSERDRLPLFVFGRSLGGAAAIHTLSRPQFRHSAKGLILQNTFTSLRDVVYHLIPAYLVPFWPFVWFVTSDTYKSIDKIKDIDVPVLFIKGKRDGLVPTRMMSQLEKEFEKSNRESDHLEVGNGTHNKTWERAGDMYFTSINEFMMKCSKL